MKYGKTIDFLLTAKSDKAAAKRFFDKAMQANGVPEKVTIDKSGANKAANDEINASRETPMVVRQVKYLNNTVEQRGHRIRNINPVKVFSATSRRLLGKFQQRYVMRHSLLRLPIFS